VNKKEVESKEVEHVFGNTEVDHVERGADSLVDHDLEPGFCRPRLTRAEKLSSDASIGTSEPRSQDVKYICVALLPSHLAVYSPNMTQSPPLHGLRVVEFAGLAPGTTPLGSRFQL
jgi:hypothetical protein